MQDKHEKGKLLQEHPLDTDGKMDYPDDLDVARDFDNRADELKDEVNPVSFLCNPTQMMPLAEFTAA